jgi:Acetyltransferase (GNAT) domain
MKKAEVRPHDNAQLEEGVERLRILAYPYFPEVHDVEYYSNFYSWFEGHPLGNELHRWIVVNEDEEIVGHLAATPQYYRIGGKRVVAHTPADYMVHPQYGFHALLLMRRFFSETQNCVACDMVPAVISVQTRLGARAVGKLQYAVKLLDVSRLPAPPIPAPIKRILNRKEETTYVARGFGNRPDTASRDVEDEAPPPPRPRAPIPARVKRLLNGGLETIDHVLSRGYGSGLNVEVLEGFDASFDELFERVAAAVLCVPEKDAAFLSWRYSPDSPQPPVTILGVRTQEGLLGYAVLLVTLSGEDGYVLDLTTLPGRRDVARALLSEAVRFFRRAGAHIIRFRFTESPTSPAVKDAWRLGFFFRSGRRHELLVKFADRGLHKTALDPTNWSYSVGDGEASFWIR